MNSEVAHLRKELLIIHQENLRLKEFVTSMNDVHGKAIIQQTERLNREYERAERLQSMVTNLQKRIHIEESWNGRPSESVLVHVMPNFLIATSSFRHKST